MDAIFSIRLWDYTEDFFNLNGRISIFYSLAWGTIAILFVNHMYPFTEKKVKLILNKIPYITQSITIYILFSIYIIDTLLSFIHWK